MPLCCLLLGLFRDLGRHPLSNLLHMLAEVGRLERVRRAIRLEDATHQDKALRPRLSRVLVDALIGEHLVARVS